jgi:RHS repeat-associated protein
MARGSFRRFASLTLVVSVAATGLVAQRVVERVGAQGPPVNLGKANPGASLEKARPVPAAKDEVPTSFEGRIEAPKGEGSPDWTGKSDAVSNQKRTDYFKNQKNDPKLPAGSVEGLGPIELLDKSRLKDGDLPKVVKSKKQQRKAQTEVDDPVVEPVDVRGPSVPVQISPDAPKPPTGTEKLERIAPGAGYVSTPPILATVSPPRTKPAVKASSTVIDLRSKTVVAEVVADGGDWIGAAGKAKVRLSDLDDPEGTVQVATVGGAEVGFRPIGGGKRVRPDKANRRVGSKSGSNVSWANAFTDGSSLVEQVTTTGVKGSILLAKKPGGNAGGNVWQFELVLSDGLTPLLGNGSIVDPRFRVPGRPVTIFDANGDVVGEIPAGVAIDAAGVEAPVDLELRKAANDRWVLEVSVSADWLRDKARVYPVDVDPSYVLSPGGGANASSLDGIVGPIHYYTSDLISDQLPGYGTRNLLVKLNLGPALGASVSSAILNVHVGNCQAPNAWDPYKAFGIGVSPLNAPYQPGALTPGAYVGPTFIAPSQYGSVISYNITPWVQNWASGTWANHGLRFQMERYAWAGQPNSCELYLDNLTVDTANRAPIASSSSPAHLATNVAASPTFATSASDPDGDPISYYFDTCYPSYAAPVACANSGWTSASSWTRPSPMPYLTTGEWRSWITDPSGPSVYLGPRTFTTQAAPNGSPGALVMVAPTNGATGQLVRPKLTATATDPNGDPLQYRFRICASGCPVGQDWISGPTWDTAWQSSNEWTIPTNLPYYANLYWLVEVRDVPPVGVSIAITSAWSAFQTLIRPNTQPNPPTLVSPADQAVNQSNRPFLQATGIDPEGDPVVFEYTVCGWSQAEPCVISPWVAGAWQPPTTSALKYGVQYFWQARQADQPPNGSQVWNSNASTRRYFQVGANPTSAPTAPVAAAPLTGESISNKPILQVKGSNDSDGDAIEFQFQICSPNFTNVDSQCFTSGWRSKTTWQVTGNLDWKTTYVWRAFVRNTLDSGGTGIPMATPQTVVVSTPTIDDPVTGASGFNPYVDLDGDGDFDGGVNEAIGQLTYSKTDVMLPAVAPGLMVSRTYNSRIRTRSVFGRGFFSNLDAKIVRKANQSAVPYCSDCQPVEVILPDGRREYFSRNANGTYVSASNGFYSDLSRDAATPIPNFVYVLDNRSKFTFDGNGVLKRFEDRNGNLLNYTYVGTAPNERLDSITDAKSGRALSFTYNAAGRIDKVSTPVVSAHGGKLETFYSYTGDNLTKVCPPTTPTVTGCWQYGWTGDRLTSVTKPKGNKEFEVGYDNQGFVLLPAVNKAPNPSFEDPTVGWVSEVGASASAVSTEAAFYDAKSLKGNFEAGKPTSLATANQLAVLPNKQYTINAFVKGTVAGGSSGIVMPYWQGFDEFGIAISQGENPAGFDGYVVGGSAIREGDPQGFETMDQWTPIRGSFRTSENTKFVKVWFKWATPTAAVYLDGVSLIQGDGLTNRVQWRKDGRGNLMNYTYAFNGANIEVTTTSPRPGVPFSKSIYNEKFKLISSIDAGLRTTSYEYDANGFLWKITDPAGRLTELVNDSRGNVTKRTWKWLTPERSEYFAYKPGTDLVSEFRDARSSGPADNTYLVKYSYDTPGNRTAEIDPLNNSRVWTYADGTETAIGPGAGTVPKGRMKSAADRSGLVAFYGYDNRGDLYRLDNPSSGVTTFVTDEIGRTISETKLLAGVADAVTTRTYDVRSRLDTITGPAVLNKVTNVNHQAKATTTYDPNDNPLLTSVADLVGGDPTRQTSYTYTNDDQVETITEPLGRVTSYQYDEVGNRVRTYDPRQVRTRTYYNDRNLPESTFLENYFDTPTAAFIAPTTGTRSIRLHFTTYDNLGRIDEITDAENRVTKTEYWPDDQIKQTSRRMAGTAAATGIVTAYREYDNVGNLTRSRAGSTETVANVYNSRGFLERQTVDPTGVNRLTTYTTDPEGRVLTSTTGVNVVTNTYAAATKLLETQGVSAVGAVTSFAYDTRGRLKTKTSGRSYFTTYTYDQLDRVIKVEDPSTTIWTNGVSAVGRPTTQTGYNTFGEVTNSQDPRNLVTTLTKNTLGQTSLVTYPTNDGVTPTETFVYDLAGNQTSMVDRRGKTTDYTVDAFGRTGTTLLPAPAAGAPRPTTTVTFDDVSQQKQVIDPNGVTTKATWDPLGRQITSSVVVRQQANAERITQYGYDDAGRLRTTTDPLTKIWTTDYNGAGQAWRTTDPTGAQNVTTFYEPMGWVNTVTVGGKTKTKNTYDNAGRLKQTDALNITTDAIVATDKYDYDFDSNQYSHTRPNNATDTTTFDELGRVAGSTTTVETGVYSTAVAGFDAASNQVRVVDPRSNITTASYNNWNLLSSTVEPATTAHPGAADRTWTVGYSPAGDVTSETRPGGVNVTKSYDFLGRLTSETGVGTNAASATRSFGYDAGGRLTSAGTQSFAYFDSGQLQNSAGPAGTSSFEIDPAGRTLSRTDAAGTSTFGYNDRGNMNTYTTGGTTVGVDWRSDGLVSQINYPLAVTRMFGYDEMGRITDDHTKTSTGSTLARREYTYNPDSSVKTAKITATGGGISPPGTVQPAFIPTTASGSRDVLVTASYVYWTNLTTGTIGRANLDGTGVNQNFITGIDAPSGIATDGTYLYWTTGGLNDTNGTGGIARSLLDGTSRNNTFITGGNKPIGLAVTASYIYWTNFNSGTIGRAAINGTGVNQSFIASGSYPYGLETNGSYLYWTNFLLGTGAAGTNIGRADIGGTNINTTFITGANGPAGITSDGTYLYWANLTSIGRAALNGTGVNQTYVAGTFPGPGTTASPVSIVADATTNLYFSNYSSQKVARVDKGGAVGGPSQDYSYTYDLGSRLRGFTGPTGSTTYTYDLAGNRLTANGSTFVYDERNRITSGGGLTYTWTPRGSLAATTGTGGTTYAFDGLDRMTSAGGVTYTYDSLDRVLARNGAAPFAYAGTETDPVSEGTNLYRRSSGGSLLGLSRAGVSVLTGMERHGDLAFTLNPTTGAIADTVINDPFGKPLSFTGSKPNTGFQGDYTDPTNNLVWMAARWYNPTTGTFTTRDTYPGNIGAYGTLNRYTYGLNDPARYWDPTGHYSDSEIGAAIRDANADPTKSVCAISHLDSRCNDVSGTENQVNGWWNVVKGVGNQVTGNNNTVIGNINKIIGDGNQVFGTENTVISSGNVIHGSNNGVTTGGNNVVIGNFNILESVNSIVVGDNNRVTGRDSIVLGSNNFLFSVRGSLVLGNKNTMVDAKNMFLMGNRKYATNGGPLDLGPVLDFLFFDDAKSCFAIGENNSAGSRAVSCFSIVPWTKVFKAAKFGLAVRAANRSAALVEVAEDGGRIVNAAEGVEESVGAARKVAEECVKHSFSADTLVVMADGSKKPIGKIAVGDLVLAMDPVNRKTSARVVTMKWTNVDDDLIDLLVLNETIHTTRRHRFWSESRRNWVHAEDLRPGDQLVDPDGKLTEVGQVTRIPGTKEMIDLTVANDHTFFVAVSLSAVLVHNQDFCWLTEYRGPGRGHHVPAKSAFIGADGYNLYDALAISNKELARLKINHNLVTKWQGTLYRELAASGGTATWGAVSRIEKKALVKGGMSEELAEAVVDMAVKSLKESGVAGPTRIPWGGGK